MPVSFPYIHIPFCVRKCLYCDFFSIPFDYSIADSYIDALLTELDLRGHDLGRLKTIYIGGGTPTVLPSNSLRRLFEGFGKIPWHEDIEITIEANPNTADREKVSMLLDLGVNRFSLGIQSFIDRELSLLGRVHDSSDALSTIEMMKRESVRNLSIDLIYGIPGQSLEDWHYNLSRAIECSPEHISTYELTPERGTPLYEMLLDNRFRKPDDDVIVSMYYETIDKLAEAGYRHYEISNFAGEGFQCRHNLNYWDRGEYIGLGAGSHSFENELRRVNQRDIKRYINTVKRGIYPFEEETKISQQEALREHIFLGLRKIEGINTRFLKERFNIDIILASSGLISDGLLEMEGDNLRLSRRGLVVFNSVIVQLFLALNI